MFSFAKPFKYEDLLSVRIATKQEVDSFFKFIESKKPKPLTLEMERFALQRYSYWEGQYRNGNCLYLRSCSICGSRLIEKSSQYGSFYCCPKYPKCIGMIVGIEKYNSIDKHAAQRYLYSIKTEVNEKFGIATNQSTLRRLFESEGLGCLCEIYSDYEITCLDTPVKVKKASDELENNVYELAKSTFPDKKIARQQAFRFTLRGKEDKPKLAFIDLLISNENKVNIIEIKMGNGDCDDKQLQNYTHLIKFFESNRNSTRIIDSFYLVENISKWTTSGTYEKYYPETDSTANFKIYKYESLSKVVAF